MSYRYNPTQWPPDVALAELHSRCSMPGEPTPNEVKCPCCGNNTKTADTRWFKEDIYQDFGSTSSGICGYFLLLRTFVGASFVLVLLGSIYQLIQQYRFCEHRTDGSCYTELFLQFVDFKTLIDSYGDQRLLLSGLAVAMYVVLLVANVLILHNLLLIKKSCESMFTHNTLLVSNMDAQRLATLIDGGAVALDQIDTVTLEDVYDEYQLRRKCKLLFYEIQAVRATEYQLSRLGKLNDRLRSQTAEIYEHGNADPTSFLVTFRHEEQAHRIEECFRRAGIFYEYLKYPKDMRWEHAGQNVRRCRYVLSQVWIVCEVLLVAVLLCLPILVELKLDSINLDQLTIGQFV
ncbi:MAG: hypothetical protein JST59_00655 [Actinobacteria bacterium]|nr:hypothetical protein [Actinomycetota bacterium]